MKGRNNVTLPRKVTLRVHTRYEPRKVIAGVAVVGETHIAQGATIELQLVRVLSGEVLQRKKIKRLLPGGRSEVSFPMSKLSSGCCGFRAVFVDRYGTELATEILQDKACGKVPWLGAKDGISRQVPAPWTAMKTRRTRSGLAVECWGRTYEFDRCDFLKSARSRGRSLLAGPVRLVAKVNGREIRWQKGTLRPIATDRDQAIFSQSISGAGLTLTTHTTVQFDGMIRVDWAVSPRKPLRLDGLTLEVPVRAQHAKYLYQFPGKWGTAENARALPPRGVRMGFHPYIWLGDEQRGLAWFAESDENWFNRNRDRVTEIKRKGGVTWLRLHLVSSPVSLVPGGEAGSAFTGLGTEEGTVAHVAENLRYTFGFQATPVKPVEQDAWDYRTVCIGEGDLDLRRRLAVPSVVLDRLAGAGVRTVVIFEYWTDPEGHCRPVDAAQLKRIIKACRARGLKVLLYFSFLISDLASEWRDFGKECMVQPKRGYPIFHYLPQSEQSAWLVCLRSVWQDFLAAGIARVMDELGVDGVYLDGTELPHACCNTNHGCGTVRADGSIAPTYPIFAVRSAMRRIYHAVRSRRPDGQVNVHNSTCMTMPTLGWATSYWDGEQFQNIPHGKGTEQIGTLLPLDAFRAEFMGHQWGPPAEFLCYGEPFTHQEAWAFSLLHDVPVRPGTAKEQLQLASAHWRVMDEFGRKEAEWLPYWENGQYVSVRPKDAYASLYLHPENGVLAVVSNLGHKKTRVNLQLHLSRLGLGRRSLTTYDALAGRRVQLNNGRISLQLPSFGCKLLWIR